MYLLYKLGWQWSGRLGSRSKTSHSHGRWLDWFKSFDSHIKNMMLMQYLSSLAYNDVGKSSTGETLKALELPGHYRLVSAAGD